MSGLRDSVNAIGLADPEVAIVVHALVGDDLALLEHAGDLPAELRTVPTWVKSTFLNGEHPYFTLAEHAVAERLGERPTEPEEALLQRITVRPRTIDDLRHLTGYPDTELKPLLERLDKAGLIFPEPNPLRPERPFWMMADRPARFYYALMAEHLERWRRGRITDKLWRMNQAKFGRYIARAEYTRLAREWALGSPRAATVTRLVVPDPRHRQLRALEVAAWDADGELTAIGTVRWALRMRERQLKRLRYVRRLLGDPPADLYCIAPRVEPAIADDPADDLYRVGPAHLLRGD